MPRFLLLWLLCAGLLGISEARAQEAPLTWNRLPEAFRQAQQEEQPVLVYVHAPWCGPCLRMERAVFPEVAPLLRQFARAGLDFDDHESRLAWGGQAQSPFAWARHFGVEATPGFVFLEPDGAVLTRMTGYLDAEAFGLLLAYVATGAYRHASFEEYVRRTRQEP